MVESYLCSLNLTGDTAVIKGIVVVLANVILFAGLP